MNPKDVEKEIRSRVDGRFLKLESPIYIMKEYMLERMTFKKISLSIQASEYHYCSPRNNTERYDCVEVGFPNFLFSESFINKYAEDKDSPMDTVYGFVPIVELSEEISLALSKQ